MKTLTDTKLFEMFVSYIQGGISCMEELHAAYDNFVAVLSELSVDEDLISKLRRLNYTRIELFFIRQNSNGMSGEKHVVEMFMDKTIALLDTEIEMLKEICRHGGTTVLKPDSGKACVKRMTTMLSWNGTDSDLIELVAALMAAGSVSFSDGRKLTVIDLVRVFEEMFNLKINALYTKRGKVFDRCTDTTPFIDSLRVSYNRMLEKRLMM